MKFSSYLKEFCTIHGMSLNKCAITSQKIQQNSKIHMNWQAKLNLSTYMEINEPNMKETEVAMKDFSPTLKLSNQILTFSNLAMMNPKWAIDEAFMDGEAQIHNMQDVFAKYQVFGHFWPKM